MSLILCRIETTVVAVIVTTCYFLKSACGLKEDVMEGQSDWASVDLLLSWQSM